MKNLKVLGRDLNAGLLTPGSVLHLASTALEKQRQTEGDESMPGFLVKAFSMPFHEVP